MRNLTQISALPVELIAKCRGRHFALDRGVNLMRRRAVRRTIFVAAGVAERYYDASASREAMTKPASGNREVVGV